MRLDPSTKHHIWETVKPVDFSDCPEELLVELLKPVGPYDEVLHLGETELLLEGGVGWIVRMPDGIESVLLVEKLEEGWRVARGYLTPCAAHQPGTALLLRHPWHCFKEWSDHK